MPFPRRAVDGSALNVRFWREADVLPAIEH